VTAPPEDEREHEGEIRRLAWVMGLTIRVATASTPADVHRALQALATGGAEPSRHTIRTARARLRQLAVQPPKPDEREGAGGR
jgi:hypothetical protein